MTGEKVEPEIRDYRLFGLRVRSCLELPELNSASDESPPDVQIEFGAVPEPAEPIQCLVRDGDALVLVVPGVARYRIVAGKTITVDASPNVPERNLRLFLLGSAFGALLHQRGLFPLHANAIEVDGKAAGFVGASGEGKSTLAMWFHDAGFRVIADDVCVLRLTDDGLVFVSPGQQRLRLWSEAIRASGREPLAYPRSFAGREDIDKFDIQLPPRRSDDCELAAVYVLETADEFSIEPLKGLAAIEAVFSHTYRGQYVTDAGSQQQHWSTAVGLVQRMPIFRLRRQRDLSLMNQNGRAILDHFAATAGG